MGEMLQSALKRPLSGKPSVIEQLVEAAISLCEPENADEKATEYTRTVLRRKFTKILRREPTP